MRKYSNFVKFVPEDSVGGITTVSNVIEEHLKLQVIVEIGSDNGTNGWGRGEGRCGDILQDKMI